MAKSKISYICLSCKTESSQWFGKCPTCGTYNALEEQAVAPSPPEIFSRGVGKLA